MSWKRKNDSNDTQKMKGKIMNVTGITQEISLDIFVKELKKVLRDRRLKAAEKFVLVKAIEQLERFISTANMPFETIEKAESAVCSFCSAIKDETTLRDLSAAFEEEGVASCAIVFPKILHFAWGYEKKMKRMQFVLLRKGVVKYSLCETKIDQIPD